MSRKRTLPGWLAGAASALLTLLLPMLPAAAQQPGGDHTSTSVLAAGSPALTEGMLTRFVDFMEWVVEAPLTGEQRTRLQAVVTDAWKTRSRSGIEGTLETLKAESQVAALPVDQRALVLTKLQPEFLAALKAEPDDPINRWLLAIFDAAHAPIAAGRPPLTRQVSDAQAEMFAFMLAQAAGQAVDADQQFRDDWAKALVPVYAALPAERQAQWAQSPVIWASLRVIWARADEAQRAKLRKEWAGALGGAIPTAADRSAVIKGVKELSALQDTAKQRALTPDEMDRGAQAMTSVARALRRSGGSAGTQQAAEVEQTAAALRGQAARDRDAARQAAPAPGRGQQASASASDHKARMAAIWAKIRHREGFVSLMNAATEAHYSRLNNYAALGDSPYRYVNAYGNPY